MSVEMNETYKFEEEDTTPDIKRASFHIDTEYDKKFWNLLPTIALNLHSKSLEISWLCFSIYIDKLSKNVTK